MIIPTTKKRRKKKQKEKSMSSHNSVSDVDKNSLFFHFSYPCSGADVLLPKALFFSPRLLVLSAGSAVQDWYHKGCRSKFGLEGPATAAHRWLNGCTFEPLSCKTSRKKNKKTKQKKKWQHNTSVCP